MKTFLMQAARLQCYHNHLKTLCFFQKREPQLEVEQMDTTYWIVAMWQSDWGITWHIGWSLLILVTTLLSLWALHFVKVKMKYFEFVTWPLDRCVTWLCGWGLFILSYHPVTFGIHRPCESGNITPLTCRVTT